ncbi:MAG: ribosomal protein S18-alanine N-acetyltransferase [Acidimicrobiia bacterium]|nr:ribosomal protein S18-alanine N-acetyltransferase [Acidimicrobiia bacterium]
MSAPTPSALSVRIAPMRRRHLRSVLRIESQVYPRPWTLGLYLGELALPEERRIYLIARVGGEVVGHAGLMFAADDGHVTTVAVDPTWQRRGIAARLLLVLFREAIDRGARDLTLEVRASNGAAQALYRQFGFVEAGVRKGYYSENREDAVIMWANHVDTDEYRQRLDRIEAGLTGLRVIDELHAGRFAGRRS